MLTPTSNILSKKKKITEVSRSNGGERCVCVRASVCVCVRPMPAMRPCVPPCSVTAQLYQ